MNAPVLAASMPWVLASGWRQVLAATVLCWGWVLFLYRDAALAMVAIWSRSATFTHGFLVLPIALWLIWRQRHVVSLESPHVAPAVLGLIALAGFAWLLGALVAVNALMQFALVSMLVLSVVCLGGYSGVRPLAFPLAFLFFAVPIGEFLLPTFMEWTANFTVTALRLSGIAVYREGLNFVIPSGSWSVVEACSGVRYLIASLMVGTLYAYLNYQSTQRRIVFAGVSLVVPIVANWLRAYMIVLIGHLSGNTLATGIDHLIYGWVFFGIVVLLTFMVGARWSESDQPRFRPKLGVSARPPMSVQRLWGATACFVALVALPPVALGVLENRDQAPRVTLEFPSEIAPRWQPVTPGQIGFKPVYQSPSAQIHRAYRAEGSVLELYVAFYRNQDSGHELVRSDNVLLPRSDGQWNQVYGGQREVAVDTSSLGVRTVGLHQTAMSNQMEQGRLVAWQFYWINGKTTTSDYLAKAYSAFNRLLGRIDDSAVVVVYTAQGKSEAGEALLASFMSENFRAIHEQLMAAHQRR